ncbi:hypothetical protein Tco_0523650 [Tanacetum coccineum]
MESNEEIRRLAQEAEKQQLFAQKVQQQNTTLTSQLELYKERNRILENINKDNNYLNEFLEADERAKRYNKQAQSQLVRDRDIIRDLEKQRDKLELDVKDYKRQKEEYQKTQKIFNQTQCNKEEKYLDDILQLQAKIKDFENVVCKIGKSTETLRLLTNEQKAFRDNLRKSGLGYNGPYVLSQAYAKIPKLYNAYELCNKSEQLYVFDSEETLENAFKSQQKMIEKMNDPIAVANKQKLENDLDETFKQNELLKDQLLEASLAEDIKNLQHKSRENNSLKTLQKENENFMASLQIENAHLKQTYKDLFDSVQRSRVETNHCDEVKVKVIQLEKIIAQKSKDFDDVNLELSNSTTKFEAYFEKLEKMKVVLERQLARKVDDSKAEKD